MFSFLQTTADGFTILEKAIIEHNMLATGKIYFNIRIPELSNILLIDERRTEKVAAVMIGEGRLNASIDQLGKPMIVLHSLLNLFNVVIMIFIIVERLLIFENENDPIEKLNHQITGICEEVSKYIQ